MVKVGFLLSIGLCGCDSRELVEFEEFHSLEDTFGERPAKDYILEYGYEEAKQAAESYGYYEEEEGVFLNDEGDEVTPEATAYLLTTPEEEEAFTDGLDKGIGQLID